jgi:hypothetical protein
MDKNIVYQDNKSAILLETSSKKSSGKWTCALNIRYFFLTDQVEKGNVQIEHYRTNNMVGVKAFARQEVPKILQQYPWTLMRRTGIYTRQRVTSHKTKNNLKDKRY